MVPRADLERLALHVRRLARLDDRDLQRAPEIAMRILGPDALHSSTSMSCAGRLTRDERGRQIIVVRPDADDLNHVIAHELAHYALREFEPVQLPWAEEEAAANFLGAAILAPSRSIEIACGCWGRQIARLARAFGVSQTSMNLRCWEVFGEPRVVVTAAKRHLILAYQERLPWSEPEAQLIQVADGARRLRHIAKARIRAPGIDAGRVVLRPSGT